MDKSVSTGLRYFKDHIMCTNAIPRFLSSAAATAARDPISCNARAAIESLHNLSTAIGDTTEYDVAKRIAKVVRMLVTLVVCDRLDNVERLPSPTIRSLRQYIVDISDLEHDAHEVQFSSLGLFWGDGPHANYLDTIQGIVSFLRICEPLFYAIISRHADREVLRPRTILEIFAPLRALMCDIRAIITKVGE